MKKFFAILLSAMLACTGAAALASDDGTAYDAFATLSDGLAVVASLDEIMSGVYAVAPATAEEAQPMAGKLEQLTAVTIKDIAVYAAARGLSDVQVRDAYYMALSNVLDAELMLNPGDEARYEDVKAMLALYAEQMAAAGTQNRNTANSPDTPKTGVVSVNTNRNTNRNTNTPERNTTNTPEYNSPDTPERNSPDTPERNSPDTPDRNSEDSPERDT